jgi:hypothetical protein
MPGAGRRSDVRRLRRAGQIGGGRAPVTPRGTGMWCWSASSVGVERRARPTGAGRVTSPNLSRSPPTVGSAFKNAAGSGQCGSRAHGVVPVGHSDHDDGGTPGCSPSVTTGSVLLLGHQPQDQVVLHQNLRQVQRRHVSGAIHPHGLGMRRYSGHDRRYQPTAGIACRGGSSLASGRDASCGEHDPGEFGVDDVAVCACGWAAGADDVAGVDVQGVLGCEVVSAAGAGGLY